MGSMADAEKIELAKEQRLGYFSARRQEREP
jgi:hypothetical protein